MYRENNRYDMSWEQRVRLWNSIVRGSKLSDSKWSHSWSEFSSVQTTYKVTRTVYTKEVLIVLRRWIEKVRTKFSDKDFQSCLTKYYRANHVDYSDSDIKLIATVKTESNSSRSESRNTRLSVKSSSSSRSSRSTSSRSSSKVEYFVQMYKDYNRYDLSIEDRIRLWTSISRGYKCTDGEWKTLLSRLNEAKSSFHVSNTVYNKDILVLIRRWNDRCHKSFSDSQWKTCVTKYYESNHITYSEYDIKVVTWVHSGGSYTEESNSSSQNTALAVSHKNHSSEESDDGSEEESSEEGVKKIEHVEETRTEHVRQETTTQEHSVMSTSSSGGNYQSSH